MKQTAVEWFEKELQKNFNIEGIQLLYDDILEKAKEMENEQKADFAIEFKRWYETECTVYNGRINKNTELLLKDFKEEYYDID